VSVTVVVPDVTIGAAGSCSELLGSYKSGAGIPGLLLFVTTFALSGAETSSGLIPFFMNVICASCGSALRLVMYMSVITQTCDCGIGKLENVLPFTNIAEFVCTPAGVFAGIVALTIIVSGCTKLYNGYLALTRAFI